MAFEPGGHQPDQQWPTPPSRPPQRPDVTAGGYPTGPPAEPRITYTAGGRPVPAPPPIGQPVDPNGAGFSSPFPDAPPPPVPQIIGYTPGGYPILAGGAAPPQQRSEAPFPPARHRDLDGFAVAAFVFGLVGGVVFALAFGIAALREPRKSRHHGAWLAAVGLVLAMVWSLGLAVYFVHRSSPTHTQSALQVTAPTGPMDPVTLQVGACAQVPPLNANGSPITAIPVVPCNDPHNGQVITRLTLVGTASPGDPTFMSHALAQCRDAVPGFLGDGPTTLQIVAFTPGLASWTTGDHTAACLLVDPDKQITGDIRNDR